MMNKAFIIVLAITFSASFAKRSFAQSYRKERSTFDVGASIGFADKQTKDYFGTSFSAGLRKEWSLGKLISLNVIGDYTTLSGKHSAPSLNLINLGGGLSIYPRYLISLIFNKEYNDETARSDGFYLDESFGLNVNDNKYAKGGDVANFKFAVNLFRLPLSEHLAVSPKVGFSTVFLKENLLPKEDLNYFFVGVSLNLGKFTK